MYFHSPYTYRMPLRCPPDPVLASEGTDIVLTFLYKKTEKNISKCNKSKSVGIFNKWEKKLLNPSDLAIIWAM